MTVRSVFRSLFASVAVACALTAAPLSAAVPALIPTQGILYDEAGVPLTGVHDVVFSLYPSPGAETPIWSEIQTLEFTGGLFSAYLGASSPLSLAILGDAGSLTLGIALGEEPETARIPFGTVPFAAWAQFCADAQTLDGYTADDLLDLVELGAYTDADAIAATESLYAAFDHVHDWTDIVSGMPAGFADGIDNDSGGDITSVGAGTGLTGGGDTGAVSLALDTSYAQRRVVGTCPAGSGIRSVAADGSVECATPYTDANAVAATSGLYAPLSHTHPWSQLTEIPAGFADGVDNDRLEALSCAADEIPRRTAAGWVCSTDRDSGGDITAVTTGSGLTGGNTTGAIALGVDTSYLQRRVVGTCPLDQAIRVVNVDGSVSCSAAGDITGVLTGSGLTGGSDSGTVTINVDTTYLQRRVAASCPGGQSIRAIAQDGTVTCEVDDTNIGDITSVNAGSGLTGGNTSGDATLAVDYGILDARYVNSVGNDSVSGNLAVGGALSSASLSTAALDITNCRLCLYYADSNGGSARRVACVRFDDGSTSGNMNLAGDVDGNDILRLQVQCDGGSAGVFAW